jgi:hypothetical protein
MSDGTYQGLVIVQATASVLVPVFEGQKSLPIARYLVFWYDSEGTLSVGSDRVEGVPLSGCVAYCACYREIIAHSDRMIQYSHLLLIC